VAPSPVAKIPDDACATVSVAELTPILAPAVPFGSGHVNAAGPATCEWSSGPVTGPNSIDVTLYFALYNQAPPFDTTWQQVSGLGTDVAVFRDGNDVHVLRARKDGVVARITMIKHEAGDLGLAHTRAIMEKILAKL
jgi:hypothetical protein